MRRFEWRAVQETNHRHLVRCHVSIAQLRFIGKESNGLDVVEVRDWSQDLRIPSMRIQSATSKQRSFFPSLKTMRLNYLQLHSGLPPAALQSMRGDIRIPEIDRSFTT